MPSFWGDVGVSSNTGKRPWGARRFSNPSSAWRLYGKEKRTPTRADWALRIRVLPSPEPGEGDYAGIPGFGCAVSVFETHMSDSVVLEGREIEP